MTIPHSIQALGRKSYLLPASVFVIGLVITGIYAAWWHSQIYKSGEAQFQFVADRIGQEITARLTVSSHSLVGARGMLATHDAIRRDDFKAYAESRDIANEFPGVQGIAFVQRVMKGELDSFVAAARNDGLPNFSIKKLSSSDSDELYVVRVIEPEDKNAHALGLDIGSESKRREGIRRAVETGLPAISPIISLVQDQQSRAAVLLNLPVFEAGPDGVKPDARHRVALGVINAPIVISELLKALPEVATGVADIELFESEDALANTVTFFDSRNTVPDAREASQKQGAGIYKVTITIPVPGREWVLRVSSLSGFESKIDFSSLWLIFSTGTLLSGLLALLLWNQNSRRRNAESYASKMALKVGEEEKRFRDFSQSSADWFWETDAEHRFSYLSENSPHILDSRPLDTLMGKTRIEVALEDGLASDQLWSDHMNTIKEHKPFRDFEYGVLDGAGRIVWLSVSGIPIFDDSGAFAGYRGIGQVVTERRKVEDELAIHQSTLELLVESRGEELAAVESRLRSVIDASLDGIIQVDGSGKILLINPAASQLLGYGQNELIGASLHTTIHHSYPDGKPYPIEACPVARSISQGSTLTPNEDTFWRADGSSFPVICSFQPIQTGAKTTGGVLTFSDNTARFEAEKAQEKARLEAENLARLKSEFLANMSHEIRTPLNGVLGMAQVGLRESAGRKRQQELFGRILNSGDLLLGVINDILDFSKIEAGKLQLESIPLNPLRLAEDALALCSENTKNKDVQLTLEKEASLPEAMLGDPVRLSQILINLLSNAVKFTMKGTVCLHLKRVQHELVFAISDSGIGMTADEIERLFHPFEQADTSTTRKFGGTGLGLAISQQLALLMGGKIDVQSTKGIGSTFTLRIPYFQCEKVTHDTSRALHSSGIAKRLTDVRILAAEDNEFNQLVLGDMLNLEGARLTLVSNGQEALDAVIQRPGCFDVVLMDVQMPVMDGREATRAILKIAPALPIIGLTAHAIYSEQAECLAVGMIDVVTKPYKDDELVASVTRHVGRASQQPPSLPAVQPALTAPPIEATRKTAINWANLELKHSLKPAFLHRLISVFVRTNIDRPAQIRASARNGLSELAAIAHSLKGSAHHIEATDVVNWAIATEEALQRADENILDFAEGLATALERSLAEAKNRLAN